MATSIVSTKGQIVIPAELRTERELSRAPASSS